MQPYFLKEEPLPGKPSPERIREYVAYLRYQLHRGVRVHGSPGGPCKSDEATGRIGERQAWVLRRLAQGPTMSYEIRAGLGLTKMTLQDLMSKMTKRGLVDAERFVQGKYSCYTITENGLRALRGMSA